MTIRSQTLEGAAVAHPVTQRVLDEIEVIVTGMMIRDVLLIVGMTIRVEELPVPGSRAVVRSELALSCHQVARSPRPFSPV